MRLFFKWLKKVELVLACLCLAVFSVITFAQVVFRLLLNSPIAWAQEVSIFLFIWSVFLGACLVYANRGHFRVDFVYALFPAKMRAVLDYFSHLCVVAFSIVLIVFGWQLMMVNVGRVTESLAIPQAVIYLVIPLNGVLVLLHTIEQIYYRLAGKEETIV